MKKNTILYYENELEDDFAGVSRNHKVIPDDYKYINRNPLWKGLAFLAYRIIMTPIAYLYCHCKFYIKIMNRQCLKQHKKEGYFLYGNHTQLPGDGYFPTLITFPKKPYVIVHPDNVALKGTEQFMLMIGAVPIPSGLHGVRNLMKAIETRIEQKHCIVVYPEAHIWPYYTQIRPFRSVSFKYPVKLQCPSYCFTTVYKKAKFGRKPRIELQVEGPFYPKQELSPKAQQEDLRNRIYDCMVEHSKQSNYEYIQYRKKEEES